MHFLNSDRVGKMSLITGIIAILLFSTMGISDVNALDLSNADKLSSHGQNIKCVHVIIGCGTQGAVESSGDTIINGKKVGSENINGNGVEAETAIIVKLNINCRSDHPVATCESIASNFEPRDFKIIVTGLNPEPSQFAGSSSPTKVSIDPGDYEVTEDTDNLNGKAVFVDDSGDSINPMALIFFDHPPDFSDGCSGTIHFLETKVCTITNSLFIAGLTN